MARRSVTVEPATGGNDASPMSASVGTTSSASPSTTPATITAAGPSDYQHFLRSKLHTAELSGFRPRFLPDWLFDFQGSLVEWATRKGRAAIFADCGLGKTPMQLVWAQNVIEQTNKPVLVVTPLAVSSQTSREGEKFSIDCERVFDGKISGKPRVVITNYERLHHFDPSRFSGAVGDESSILKNFDGATKATVTEFMRRLPYRLLCTATAAPNDHIELGTSSEAIGEMGYTDMLSTFFKNDENSLAPLSYRSKWRFKPHAERPFWQWLCTWARAVRKPSDLGFSDDRFILPSLSERVHIVSASRPLNGMLFAMPARTLPDQRAERRQTITERCETVAELSSGAGSFVSWCHLNDEADMLEDIIDGAVQVSGQDEDETKVEKFDAFMSGQVRVLITKPRIGGFGLNWQHCHRMSVFPSHSYEQYYQSVRRCWRFGQTHDVTVDIVSTEGEADVMGNLKRKSDAADRMFAEMVAAMGHELSAAPKRATHGAPTQLPNWMEAACSTR